MPIVVIAYGSAIRRLQVVFGSGAFLLIALGAILFRVHGLPAFETVGTDLETAGTKIATTADSMESARIMLDPVTGSLRKVADITAKVPVLRTIAEPFIDLAKTLDNWNGAAKKQIGDLGAAGTDLATCGTHVRSLSLLVFVLLAALALLALVCLSNGMTMFAIKNRLATIPDSKAATANLEAALV